MEPQSMLRSAAIPVLAAAAARMAAGQPAIWTNGAGDGLWHTPGNWNINMVPGGNHDVVIGPNLPGVVARFGINAVNSVNAQSPLSIGAGNSSFAAASSFTDFGVVNNVLTAGGPVIIAGASTMAGVTFGGPVQWRNTGEMGVNPGLLIRSGTTFINEGRVRVGGAGASLTLSGVGALMDNRGTLELAGAVPILSNGTLSGPGTFRKSGAGVSVLQCGWQCGGYVEIQGGEVRLQGPTVFGPMFALLMSESILGFDAPGAAPFSHVLSGSSFNGLGTIEVNAAGTLQSHTMRVVDDTAFNLVGAEGLWLRGGMLYAGSGGVVRNSGTLTWHDTRLHGPGGLVNEGGGRMTFVRGENPIIGPDATVTNNAIALVEANVRIDQGGSIVNETDGILEMEEVRITCPSPLVAVLVNRGQLLVPPDSSPSTAVDAVIDSDFQNIEGGDVYVRAANGTASSLTLQGRALFGDGEVHIGGGGPEGAAFVLRDGWGMEVQGTHTISGAGDGSTFELESNSSLFVTAGGELLLRFGTGSNEGTFLGPDAAIGGDGPVRNFGRFTWRGDIGPFNVADFHNEAGALTVISPGTGAQLRGTFTNAAGAEVRQQGNLHVLLEGVHNAGLWSMQPPGTPVSVTRGFSSFFRNTGRLEASPQGLPPYHDSTFNCSLDNPGHVLADRGRLLLQAPVAQIQDMALTGGTWEVRNGGRIIFTQGGFNRIEGATIIGGTAGIPAAAAVREIIRNGKVSVRDPFETTGPIAIREGGQLGILPGGSATIPGGTTNGADTGPPDPSRVEQKAEGEGPAPVLITPTLVNHASLLPGGEDAAGPFNLEGDLDQSARGVIHVDLGGLIAFEEHDHVAVNGDAVLDGTLSIRLIDTFIPEAGQVFDILSVTGTLSGTFVTHDLPRLPGGAQLAVVYGPRGVTLRVDSACYPDCDTSSGVGVLDIFDFLCFQNAFAAAEPYACDCDITSGPRVCDIFDFLCFQNAFAAGCP